MLLGLTALTLIVLHQQAADLYAVPDRGDPVFSMWRMAWVAHQLPTNPRHLFDANIFYPLPATLTYSDAMILPALTGAPLLWAGVHPVVAYNLVFFSGFVLSGLGAYLLVRGLGWGRLAAWIAAVAFALCPFRLDHLSHLELQMAQWMPIALLCVHRLLAGGGPRYGVALALAVAAQWYSSMYYGLFLTIYAAVFAGVLVAIERPPLRRVAYGAAAVVGAALLVWPLASAYLASQPHRGERGIDAVREFSAVPADYLRPSGRHAVYRALRTQTAHPERALFPGIVPIALAVAGAWPPLGATRVSLMAAGAVAFDGSLGLNGLLYPLWYKAAMPFRSVRAPARFAILVALTLAVLAAEGARRILQRLPGVRARLAVTALCTVALTIDSWPRYRLLPMWRSPPAIYASLPQEPGAVLFEFPVHAQPERFEENLPYMYFSIWHWTPMVNGYSGSNPPAYAALLDGTAGFPRGQTLDYLARAGVTHMTVHCRLWDTVVCAGTMRDLDDDPRVRQVARAQWYGAPSALYEFRR